MKFSEQWLRDVVDPPLDSEGIARLLTMAGIEVEAIEPVAGTFSRVLVGRVLEVSRHPNADRLSLCTVDVGAEAPLSIVCGAPNVVSGMKAPVALVGAELPAGAIRAAKVRGVESAGMLCSARELGLSQDHSGLLVLPADAPVGADLRRYLELDDRLFTLKLTPNRGDCLSIRGIARELSILSRAPLRLKPAAPVTVGNNLRRHIRVEVPDACPRYCGRVLRGLNARAVTPGWMVSRLDRSGLRPISAIVDVTNYVMLEMGQPLHAFDNARINGDILVRMARPGEQMALLNGLQVALDPDMLLIADDGGPLALGGVMGGMGSAVSDSTTEVFLEAAFFSPAAIAGRARRLKLNSDAAYRYERGVDFSIAIEALERASGLMLDICGGTAGAVSEAISELPPRRPIVVRTSRATRIIGVEFSDEQVADQLARLQVSFTRQPGVFRVIPPSHRFDLQIEEDVVEEIARLYGYDEIPARAPEAPLEILRDPEARRSLAHLRSKMVERDFFETISFSFVDAEWEKDFCGNLSPVELENPIASHMNVMRSSLIGSLVSVLRTNLARKVDRVRVFETGRCFDRAPDDGSQGTDTDVPGYRQPMRLGVLAYGPVWSEQWGAPSRSVDFFDLKGDLEALAAPRRLTLAPSPHPALHPGRSATIRLDGRVIGWIGELHPRLQQKYELPQPPVLFEVDVAPLLDVDIPAYAEVSRFPPVVRDLAVVVAEDCPVGDVIDALDANRNGLVRELKLFDVYRGKGIELGRKSLAFRVVMQDTAKTLTDEDADAQMARLVKVLATGFGAKLRA